MRREPTISKSVVPFILTNPLGIDIIVKAIQEKLSTDLVWLEKSFNRANVMSKKNEGDDEIFPECFVATNKDPINMIGLDNWSAYSFFVSRDTEIIVDFEQFDSTKRERDLSLYVYINLDDVNVIEPFEYPDVLKEQIIDSVRNTVYPSDQTLTILGIEDDPTIIFDGFTVDPAKTQFLYKPWKGYRLDFNCTYSDEEDCIIRLPTPTNLTSSNVTSTSIQLDWLLNSEGNETSVLVQSNIANAGFLDLVFLGAGEETYIDTSVIGGSNYKYRVQSQSNVSPFSNSAYSNVVSVDPPSGFDPDAQLIIDALTNPTLTQEIAINNRVVSLKSASMWGLFDGYVNAALGDVTESNGRLNWHTLTLVGLNGGIGIVDNAFDYGGVNGYISSGFTPSVDGVNYKQNDARVGCFVKENRSLLSSTYLFGSRRLSNAEISLLNTSNNGFINSYCNSGPMASIGGYNSDEIISIRRELNTEMNLYKSGLLDSTLLINSNPLLPNREMYLGAINAGSDFNHYDGSIYSHDWGGSIGFDEAVYNTIERQFLTDLGI